MMHCHGDCLLVDTVRLAVSRVIFQCQPHAHNVAKWSGVAKDNVFLGNPYKTSSMLCCCCCCFSSQLSLILKFVHPSVHDQKLVLVLHFLLEYRYNSRALSAGFKMFKCFHLLMLGNVSANVTHSLFVTSTINLNPSTSTLNPFKSVILHKHKMPVNVNL